LLDVAIIGALLYFAWSFLKRRRAQTVAAGYGGAAAYSGQNDDPDVLAYHGASQFNAQPPGGDVEQGFQQIRQYDPDFSPEVLKETLQDIFFRIQAAWMNRSLDGSDALLTSEMAAAFEKEFASMKQKGRVNRLENIAVRKVELTEVWQEMGKEYVTVLFTANLLDYTLDDQTGAVVGGDRTHPIKFQEFWTFCRDIGTSQWQLSAINQGGE